MSKLAQVITLIVGTIFIGLMPAWASQPPISSSSSQLIRLGLTMDSWDIHISKRLALTDWRLEGGLYRGYVPTALADLRWRLW